MDVAEKHDLSKYIRLNHRVISAIWQAEKGIWELKVEHGTPENNVVFDDWCHVLVSATGVLKY